MLSQAVKEEIGTIIMNLIKQLWLNYAIEKWFFVKPALPNSCHDHNQILVMTTSLQLIKENKTLLGFEKERLLPRSSLTEDKDYVGQPSIPLLKLSQKILQLLLTKSPIGYIREGIHCVTQSKYHNCAQ